MNCVFSVLYLGQTQLSSVKSYKYLGHIISCDMNDNDDIKRPIRCLYVRGNMLICKFYMCSKDVKINLFKSYISNLYTCQLWCTYKKSMFKKLEVAYNSIFRRFFGYNRFISVSSECVKVNIKQVSSIVRNMINSLSDRINLSENQLICKIHDNISLYCANSIFNYWKLKTHVIYMK